jgi:hypothetical protein
MRFRMAGLPRAEALVAMIGDAPFGLDNTHDMDYLVIPVKSNQFNLSFYWWNTEVIFCRNATLGMSLPDE